jgi:hypothetical protein
MTDSTKLAMIQFKFLTNPVFFMIISFSVYYTLSKRLSQKFYYTKRIFSGSFLSIVYLKKKQKIDNFLTSQQPALLHSVISPMSLMLTTVLMEVLSAVICVYFGFVHEVYRMYSA